MLCISLSAQQRYVDMEVRLTEPLTGDTVYTDQSFTISAYVKNLGLDTVQTTDSFAYELSFDGSVISFGSNMVPYIPLTGRYMEPGDSGRVSFSFTVNQGWQLGGTELCARVYILNTVDTLLDTITANNKSCANITVQDPPVSIASLAGNEANIKVYPNPAYDYLYIEADDLNGAEPVLQVYDVTGRSVLNSTDVIYDNKRIKMNTSTLPAGSYYYTLSHSNTVVRGKFQVSR